MKLLLKMDIEHTDIRTIFEVFNISTGLTSCLNAFMALSFTPCSGKLDFIVQASFHINIVEL